MKTESKFEKFSEGEREQIQPMLSELVESGLLDPTEFESLEIIRKKYPLVFWDTSAIIAVSFAIYKLDQKGGTAEMINFWMNKIKAASPRLAELSSEMIIKKLKHESENNEN